MWRFRPASVSGCLATRLRDTYYVQNIVVNQIPKLLSLLGELVILPAQTSSTTTYSRDNEVRFLVLDGLIKSAIDEIKDNLMAAYRGSPDDALQQAVGSTYSTLYSAVDTYVVERRGTIFSGDAAQTNVKFQDRWEAVLDSTNRAWAVSQIQLDRLLQSRIDRLRSRMHLSLATTGTLVALSIIIATMTYRQIARPIERLEKVATTVRDSKSYDVRVDNTSTNEIGRVATAFDGMLAELAAARDRERYEQSELARAARLSTMGVMTASIAHEINQPLTAIVSSGNAALRWLSNAAPDLTEVEKLLRNIVESGHRASQIIYSVRAMFRKDEHEKEWIDLNNVVEDILVLIQSKIRREAVSVRTELGNDLPGVLASRTQLQQVLMNLIANAIEAMSDEAGREKLLVIKSEVSLPANVLISVKDTGTGIDPEKMDRIFEPFFTTKSDGMGMGLSICRSIIESYGGRLWASRGETCGSSFFINLPTTGVPGASPSALKAS